MKTSKTEFYSGRLILLVILVITVLPILNMLSAALQPADVNPTGLSWPADPQWGNFVTAFSNGKVLQLMLSSLFIVSFVVPISLLFATLAGYAVGRLKIVGNRAIFLFLILGLTIPFESLMIPLYYVMKDIGVLNTQWAVIFPLIGLFMPFSVAWMRAHFLGVPSELSEAARVDGASGLQEFLRIQLPLARPAISALTILLFLWTWNQFLLPVVLISDPLKRTVAGSLTFFQGQYSSSIPLLNAGALIIIIPTILIFIAFQRQFIQALLQGAVKG